MSNKELTKELHKPFIRKLEKRKVRSSFIDNILGSDHADMQWISKFDKKKIIFYYVLLIFLLNMEEFFFKREKIYYNYKYFSKNFKRAQSQTKEDTNGQI